MPHSPKHPSLYRQRPPRAQSPPPNADDPNQPHAGSAGLNVSPTDPLHHDDPPHLEPPPPPHDAPQPRTPRGSA